MKYVFILLTILWIGWSQRVCATLLNLTQGRISQIMHEIIEPITCRYTSSLLGKHCFTIENIRNSIPRFVHKMFPTLQMVTDSTYLYIEKSSNFAFQRMSFSGHKKRNLVKIDTFNNPNGQFIEVYGPFYCDGHNNDQWHAISLLSTKVDPNLSDFSYGGDIALPSHFIEEGQSIMADRAYSKIKDVNANIPYTFITPSSIRYKNGEKQLTTLAANQTRLVTRVRNSIERSYSNVKRYKFFAHVIPVKYLSIIFKLFRFVCAIINDTNEFFNY